MDLQRFFAATQHTLPFGMGIPKHHRFVPSPFHILNHSSPAQFSYMYLSQG
jgi:hypothetical protein